MPTAAIACPWCSKAIPCSGLQAGSRVACTRCGKILTLRPEDLRAAAAVAGNPTPTQPARTPDFHDSPQATLQPPSISPVTWVVIALGTGAVLLAVAVLLVVALIPTRKTPQLAAVPPSPSPASRAAPDPFEVGNPTDLHRKLLEDDPAPRPKRPRNEDAPPDGSPLTNAPPELGSDSTGLNPASDLPQVMQDKVAKAIERGVAFLKNSQNGDGSWSFGGSLGFTGESLVGPTALPALTLLECGLAADDAHVAKAVAFVRKKAPNVTSSYETYELALAILFLDRLGDPKDDSLIQTMALRLMAAQTPTGGWTYRCPVVQDADAKHLLTVLRATRPANALDLIATAASSSPSSPNKLPPLKVAPEDAEQVAKALSLLPPSLRKTPALQPPRQDADFPATEDFSTSDNSNTQFVILALWKARRHDVPTERALALTRQRFRLSQKDAGSWGYLFGIERKGGVGGAPGWGLDAKPSMTAAGLLGLAVGHGVDADLKADAAAKPEGEDPAIEKGMKALGEHIGVAAGPVGKAVKMGLGGNGDGSTPDLYFLWSVERVGMLYGRRTVGDKEWYPWGAELLVNNQQTDGSWRDELSPNPVGSAFALLFLKRVNIARDLSTKLQFLTRIGK